MKFDFTRFNAKIRKRGFTLLEIVLVVAVGLGLIVGGIVFFGQAQSSSELTDRQRAAVGISSEVRNIARNLADYNAIASAAASKDGVAYTAVAAGANAKTNAIILQSAIPASQFRNVVVTAAGTTFTIAISGLTASVCQRLATSDLGPNSTGVCAGTTMTATYSR